MTQRMMWWMTMMTMMLWMRWLMVEHDPTLWTIVSWQRYWECWALMMTMRMMRRLVVGVWTGHIVWQSWAFVVVLERRSTSSPVGWFYAAAPWLSSATIVSWVAVGSRVAVGAESLVWDLPPELLSFDEFAVVVVVVHYYCCCCYWRLMA